MDTIAELNAAYGRTARGTRDRQAVEASIDEAIHARTVEVAPLGAKVEAGEQLLASEQRRFDALLDEVKALKNIARDHEVGYPPAAILNATDDDHDPRRLPATPSFSKALLDAGFDRRTRPSVTVNVARALGVKNITLPDGDDWSVRSPGVVELAADRRFVYPLMPTVNAGEDTAVSDFVITARSVTGTVQRAVDAVSTKAKVANTITHVVTEIPQHAVTIDDIPNQLFGSVPALVAVLEQEGRLAVQQSIDEHVYTALTANAPNGLTGADLIVQTRNAIAAMRTAGMSPNLLIIDPADAVALDLIEDGAGHYVFPISSANSSDPLFGLRVRESVAAVGADPVLVDTTRIGQLYLGTMAVEADPFTGFKENLTTLRVETNALMHVRDATAAYIIVATP